MLPKTRQRMIDAFKEHNGYMSFRQLQEIGISILNIREMEAAGVMEKFARGWYWCNACGYLKPADHKYIEIAKVDPKAVICMESACYLAGILKEEPEVISFATERTDRRKLEFSFDVNRYYFKNTGIKGEIIEKKTRFGSYYYYSQERTLCDCIRLQNRLDDEVRETLMEEYSRRHAQLTRIYEYAEKLRCIKNIQEAETALPNK